MHTNIFECNARVKVTVKVFTLKCILSFDMMDRNCQSKNYWDIPSLLSK